MGTVLVRYGKYSWESRVISPTNLKVTQALTEISDRIFHYVPITSDCLFKKDETFYFSLNDPDYTAEYTALKPFFHIIFFEVKNNKILKVFELEKVKVNYYSFLFSDKRLRIFRDQTETSPLNQGQREMATYDKNKITLRTWLVTLAPTANYIEQLLTLKVLKIKEE